MKLKKLASFIWLLVAVLFFGSCMKDKGTLTYTIYKPVLKSSAEIRANIKSLTAQPIVNAGKIYVYGNYILLNEKNKGIHIIDNSNPASPINKAFIDIPTNIDMAVRANILYADCFTDLLAIDISNINSIVLKNYVANLYPEKRFTGVSYIDSGYVVIDWQKKDTVVEATFSAEKYYALNSNGGVFVLSSSGSSSPASVGTGGSMAKITIINNRLYTITNSKIMALDISSSNTTTVTSNNYLAGGVGIAETIYPFQDKLFIGSTGGMYIYSISNPDVPSFLKSFTHAKACDPVITDGTNAFITLHAGTPCGGITNELNVVNVTNILNPTLTKVYSMTKPLGLAKDGNMLMVCDESLKVYDASDVSNLQLKSNITMQTPYDVICMNNIAIVTAADGLYQFNYSNISNIQQISKIAISK